GLHRRCRSSGDNGCACPTRRAGLRVEAGVPAIPAGEQPPTPPRVRPTGSQSRRNPGVGRRPRPHHRRRPRPVPRRSHRVRAPGRWSRARRSRARDRALQRTPNRREACGWLLNARERRRATRWQRWPIWRPAVRSACGGTGARMTFEDQVAAVTAHGFTVRQGRFLTTVLRHSGVCLRRQYYAFNGIQPGQVGCDFFEKLVSRRFASVYPYGPSGARLYHVHHKALYRAIGEPDSRLRRRGTVVRAVERLMVLDTLAKFRAGIEWLSTEHEKVTYFVHNRELSAKDLPSVSFAGASTSTTRYFAD